MNTRISIIATATSLLLSCQNEQLNNTIGSKLCTGVFADSKTFCQDELRHIVIINNSEFISCRGQISGACDYINKISPNEEIYWVFKDIRKIEAEGVVESFTSGMSLKNEICISKFAYEKISQLSSPIKRTTLLVINNNDSVVFNLMGERNREVDHRKIPLSEI